MSKLIGIRHESLYPSERRAPLIPDHVKLLTEKENLSIVVCRSPKRVFADHEYKQAGATLSDNLTDCQIILGIKEVPEEEYEAGKTYVHFSHVVKGQYYNMPRLKKMMDLGCNLIDYEKITDEQGHRLIFFGYFAGLAGMINSLWALGLRFKEKGIDTPFLRIKQAHTYNSLAEAQADIEDVGLDIAEQGLPDSILPLTVGFTGYGHVSQGAQEILGLLPVKEISPEKLLMLKNRKCSPKNLIYKVVFRQEHIAEHKEGKPFDKQDYYNNPGNYFSVFENYLPGLTVLMNCMYWEPRFPRIVTKEAVKRLFSEKSQLVDSGILHPKLTVIGDITCDPDGSIEITHKGTEIEDPLFVYDPQTGKPVMGYKGEGLLVMAVHILPSELPREASASFSNALIHYLKPIVDCNFDERYGDLDLPKAILKALILHKGELTPDYKYLEQYLYTITTETVKVPTL